jgi:L-fuconolactonase
MTQSRRQFLGRAACGLAAAGCPSLTVAAADGAVPAPGGLPIVDTHQHLWDLVKVNPPWLKGASETLRQRYTTPEYLAATQGLNVVKAVYMEVDVAPADHVAEAEHVIELCRSRQHPTVAAVIGGEPASDEFAAYVNRFKTSPFVKGVRQVLHSATKAGFCLERAFVRGMRLLGDVGWSFDLCLRAAELSDGVKLVTQCPGTRFIVDHCGNADVRAFGKLRGEAAPSHDPDVWRRDMEQFAKRPNVICKISGIVAGVPPKWTADDLAPIVNHCLDVFGPERVVFGGDWPVCLRGATYQQWVLALREIVASRPLAAQRQLWHDNAVRFYGLNVAESSERN